MDQKQAKELAKEHEHYIAKRYHGVRSLSSGASDHAKGDVKSRWDGTVFECKTQMRQQHSKSKLVSQMEKCADEAWEQALDPAVSLRFWDPQSPLADFSGWIYITARLTEDDIDRSEQLYGG